MMSRMTKGPVTHHTATDAHRAILAHLLNAPDVEGTGTGRTEQPTREALNYVFSLDQPRNRLTSSRSLHVAAARFVWMMAANNRLADIAFYEPKVKSFTDDDLTVPGSSYGMRLRQPQPGLDQLEGAIARLRESGPTRRAAVSIYQAYDSTRDSSDVPCAFGMFFHNRSHKLNVTMVMRSNNALRLLPFNIFEFSMLAEVVALEAGLELGDLTYFTGSMHIFTGGNDIGEVERQLAAAVKYPATMKPMPSSVKPLDALKRLALFEIEVRHKSEDVSIVTVDKWIQKIHTEFDPYWAQFGFLLLLSVAVKKGQEVLDQVRNALEPAYRELVPDEAKASSSRELAIKDIPLFEGPSRDEKIVPFPQLEVGREFKRLAIRYEGERGHIGAEQLLKAQEIITGRLAARSSSGGPISMEDFEEALRQAARLSHD